MNENVKSPSVPCRKCGQPIYGTAFGSAQTGWEHMPKCPPPLAVNYEAVRYLSRVPPTDDSGRGKVWCCTHCGCLVWDQKLHNQVNGLTPDEEWVPPNDGSQP